MKSEGTKHNQEPTNKNLESINAEALDSEKMSSVEGESGAERAEKTKQDKFNETVAKTLDEQDKRDEKQDETIQQQSEKNSEQDRQIDELKQIILGVKDELSSVRDENKSLHQEVQRLRNQEISENDDGIKGYVENESGLDVPEPLTQAIESSLGSEGTMEDTPSTKKTEELTHYEGDYLRRPGESDTDWEGRIREQAGKDYGEDVNVDQIVDQHKKAEEAEFEATGVARASREKIARIYEEQNAAEAALKQQLDRGTITQEQYDREFDRIETEALERIDRLDRVREKRRDSFNKERYANEDHGSFYDEANTIASEEDQRRYEEWLRRHEPEEPDDSENVPESPDDPGDSPDSPDNPDDPGDNPDDPEGGPEDPETPGDDPDNPEDPGDSQDDDLDNKLIASRTNREKEGEAYVEHVAEVALNADAEGKRKGLLKGLRKTLKGTVFRSFYKQRYSELVDLKLRSDQGLELGDDEKRKLERAKGSRMWKAMETAMSTADFGDGKVVNERLGKGGAGESAADKVNVREKFGEKAERVDDALTAETRSIMESYISGDMMEKYRNGELDLEEGLSEKEVLDRQFDGLRAKLQGEGGDGGDILAVDNFVEIAEKAKANAEKLESQIEDFSERMDRVFDGFALVSA